MVKENADLNSGSLGNRGRDPRSIDRWMNTSRYVALVQLFTERRNGWPEDNQPPRLPSKRRITKEDKDALFAAGLILLGIAIAAFVAGLL
jgi:hypothetical protein